MIVNSTVVHQPKFDILSLTHRVCSENLETPVASKTTLGVSTMFVWSSSLWFVQGVHD